MICVRTKVAPSTIEGLGVFAEEFIPAGTAVWRFLPQFDQRFTREQVLGFPEGVQKYLARYASLSTKSGLYVLCGDAGNYFNHSDDANCQSRYEEGEEEVVTYALRDIIPGEELTDNYANFEEAENPENILYEIAQTYGMTEELSLAKKINS